MLVLHRGSNVLFHGEFEARKQEKASPGGIDELIREFVTGYFRLTRYSQIA